MRATILLTVAVVGLPLPTRSMELLGRGLVPIPHSNGPVFLSWRHLGTKVKGMKVPPRPRIVTPVVRPK